MNDSFLTFRRDSRQLVRELGLFRSQYGDSGVSSPQAHILMELEEKAPLSLNEIIENVRMDKSSASRTVQRMIQTGLLKQIKHAGDQRQKQFALSQKGIRATSRIHEIANSNLKQTIATLEPEELRTILSGIKIYSLALKRSRILKEYGIRTINPTDNRLIAKVIKTILNKEFNETDEEINEMLPELDDLFTFYKRSGSKYFVVSKDGAIKGGAGIAPLNGQEKICELQKMYISADTRGNGVGDLLLRHCLKFARAAGYEGCYLDTRGTMKAAIKIYERNGFKRLTKPLGRTGHYICDNYYYLKL